jgi:hypothetical protein
MRLNLIETGHWEVAQIPYPNKIVKTKTKKRALSFLTDPQDTKNFFNGLTIGEEEKLTTNDINQQLLDTNNQNNKIDPNQIDPDDDPQLKRKQQEAKKKLINPNIQQMQTNFKKINTDLQTQQQNTEEHHGERSKRIHQAAAPTDARKKHIFTGFCCFAC